MAEITRAESTFNANVKLFIMRSFILSVYQGIYDVIYNLHILNLGFHEDFLGLMIALNMLASSFVSIPAGILCDRFNKRKLMIIFSFLSLLSMLPMFLSDSPFILLLFSVVGGACGSVGAVCATPFLTENCEKGSTVRVFSANSAFSWMATILGSAIGGILPKFLPLVAISNFGGYRMTLLLSVVLLLAGWCMLLLFKDAGPQKSTAGTRKPMRIHVSPNLLKLTAISVATGVGTGMIVPYFNVYFTKVLNASSFETGVVFAVTNALMVVGFAITPRLTSWVGKVRATSLTQFASIPFLALMAVANSFMLGSFAYTARMFLMNLAGPAVASLQMEMIDPRERGFATGFMSTVTGIVVAASTYVSGLLMAGGNYFLPYAVTICAYILAAGLMYYYFKDVERAPVTTPDTYHRGRGRRANADS